MFALYVSKLGTRERVELPYGASLSDLRQHLERGIPDFHEVRLVQGVRELADEDALEVDVTAVVERAAVRAANEAAVLDEHSTKSVQRLTGPLRACS